MHEQQIQKLYDNSIKEGGRKGTDVEENISVEHKGGCHRSYDKLKFINKVMTLNHSLL